MKLSQHIQHCIALMAQFGDADVVYYHHGYVNLPRIAHISSMGERHYEVSQAVKGQFQ